ncbi:MAG: succinylglutamate desuccinylase/aspartoacylase family protein [Deltaproteobacteria bacterium]|nr:succinylglutamate desuccinylase/aspartoacylase family protein [Deltaproteobacteria bacterium]
MSRIGAFELGLSGGTVPRMTGGVATRRAFAAGVCALAALGSALPGPAAETVQERWEGLPLLDVVVRPGESRRATLAVSESFVGAVLDTPVLVVRGMHPGPTLCLTAGIHGDELNGVEIVRRTLQRLNAQELRGTVIGVPIVNLHGFRRSSRYLPDRRDLNRYFPGRSRGSSASRIAYSFFESVIRSCDNLVDLHTGSFHRTNLPHLRANLEIPETLELARGFGSTIVVHSFGTQGTLRRAATDAGIPAITYEAGEPMRFVQSDVERGLEGIRDLMGAIGMLKPRRRAREPQVFNRSHWVRSDDGGILISQVELGERVEIGALLGTVTDPLSNEKSELRAPHLGTVIGMALNQVVMPGFAAFHLGIRVGEDPPLPQPDEDWAIEAVEDTAMENDERPEE